MQYTVHLHSEPHGVIDDSGTHRLIEYPQGENTLTWNLIVSSPVVKAFVHSHKMIVNNLMEVDDQPVNFIDWNRYGKHVSWDSWNRDADSINREMDYCKSNGFIEFDDTYSISDDLVESERIDRLNRIHYAFESALEDESVQLTASPEFFASLERLNKLVHSLEKPPNSAFGESFYVIRHSSDNVRSEFPLLTDDMYNCFENNMMNGDLYSDFFTVGKDLGHAFHTNDVELIRNREVKQQSVVSGSVCFALDYGNFGVSNPQYQRDNYHKWCKQNEAAVYGYHYDEPKYNLGRAPLGRATFDYPHMKNTLQQTPYVVGVELHE